MHDLWHVDIDLGIGPDILSWSGWLPWPRHDRRVGVVHLHQNDGAPLSCALNVPSSTAQRSAHTS
eukprot:SAG11_NODE_8979_length_956_cov_4.526254_1_plen_64_part_10